MGVQTRGIGGKNLKREENRVKRHRKKIRTGAQPGGTGTGVQKG